MGDDAGWNACTTEFPKDRPYPFCGTSMDHRHYKYVYPERGVVYDCSDTF